MISSKLRKESYEILYFWRTKLEYKDKKFIYDSKNQFSNSNIVNFLKYYLETVTNKIKMIQQKN